MTKPRILLVTHYYSTHRGGVEIVAGKIAEMLASSGYEILWAASATDPLPEPREGIRHLPMHANNRLEKTLGVPYPLWSPKALSQLRQAVTEADVVHLHDALYHGNLVAARAARKLKKPVLVTQHIGFVPYRNPLLRAALTFANKRLALRTLSKASAVVFISETTKRYFRSIGLPDTVGVLIPNGVDTDVFRPDGSASREPFGFLEERPLCLFVGRFVEKKGLPIVRALADAMPDVQWALAGWGPIDPEDWHLPNVEVFRNLSGPSLAPLYRAADLLVLPSVGEGFPLVVQEAMACGTPVLVGSEVADAYSPAAKLVFRVDASGPAPWEDNVRDLLKDRDQLRTRSAELVTFSQENWSWRRNACAYGAMIDKLIGRRNEK